MVSVADGEATEHAHDADRGEVRAAMLGKPDPLPARASGSCRPEAAVEQRCPRRLDGADDRVDGNLPDGPRGRGGFGARASDSEDAETTGAHPVPEPRQQRRPTTRAMNARERALGVDSR